MSIIRPKLGHITEQPTLSVGRHIARSYAHETITNDAEPGVSVRIDYKDTHAKSIMLAVHEMQASMEQSKLRVLMRVYMKTIAESEPETATRLLLENPDLVDGL